jgi:hypothetical protein
MKLLRRLRNAWNFGQYYYLFGNLETVEKMADLFSNFFYRAWQADRARLIEHGGGL